jgi:hypothetical protein
VKDKGLPCGLALTALLTAMLVAPAVFAQTTASITGTVTDDTGAVVPQTAVTISNIGTGQKRNVVTDVRGQYRALSLEVGQYEIRAESAGFTPVVRSGINLVVGQQAVVDVQLKVGALQEALTVTEEAPLVNTVPVRRIHDAGWRSQLCVASTDETRRASRSRGLCLVSSLTRRLLPASCPSFSNVHENRG